MNVLVPCTKLKSRPSALEIWSTRTITMADSYRVTFRYSLGDLVHQSYREFDETNLMLILQGVEWCSIVLRNYDDTTEISFVNY